MNGSILAMAVLALCLGAPAAVAQEAQRPTGRENAQERPRRSAKPRFIRPQVIRVKQVPSVEGEAFVASAHATDGRVTRQTMRVFGNEWSEAAQLLWKPRRVDARLEVTLNVPEAGTYALAGFFTRGPDYGEFQISAYGKKIGEFDGFNRHVVRSPRVVLGTVNLQRGENTLLFVVTGRDVRSTGYLLGIDLLEFSPVADQASRSEQRLRTAPPEATQTRPDAQPGTALGERPDGSMLVEGEQLLETARAELGRPRRQSMLRFGRLWSGNAQLWWPAPRSGARLSLSVEVPKAGNYTLSAWFTRAPDYGRFQLARIVGKRMHAVGAPFDGYNVRIMRSEKIVLGPVPLEAGANQFVLVVAGKHPRSTGFGVGIDALELTPQTLSEREFVLAVAAARSLPRRLSPRQRRELDAVALDLKYGRTESAKARWDHFARRLIYTNERDLDALIQWVLREAYLEENADLQDYAEKVRTHNQAKNRLRDPVGDDAQLANLDLQDHLQKQQQTLQTMSNVSKMLHDIAMAVIRKIGN